MVHIIFFIDYNFFFQCLNPIRENQDEKSEITHYLLYSALHLLSAILFECPISECIIYPLLSALSANNPTVQCTTFYRCKKHSWHDSTLISDDAKLWWSVRRLNLLLTREQFWTQSNKNLQRTIQTRVGQVAVISYSVHTEKQLHYFTNYSAAKVMCYITSYLTFITQPSFVKGAFKLLQILHSHITSAVFNT